MRAHFRAQMNDMSVSKEIRDAIKFLFTAPPPEGFLRQIQMEINLAQSDPDAVVMYLYGVKKLIEDRDSRVLDQKSSSQAFQTLVRTTLAVALFYETIPPNELLKGVYHYYNLNTRVFNAIQLH